jgi:hypothetical protein
MLSDPDLIRDLALWRAARGVPDTDLHPTGPPANDRTSSRHQRHLDRRIAESDGSPITLAPAAVRLAQAIHPGITADPQWPTLATHIAAAQRAGLDRAELRRIATSRPLPIEEPAAALAYRLIDAVGERPSSAPKPPKPVPPRPYQPTPLPTAPPEYVRATRPAPNIRSAPRRSVSVSSVPRPATVSEQYRLGRTAIPACIDYPTCRTNNFATSP